jgi:hypothetical protein
MPSRTLSLRVGCRNIPVMFLDIRNSKHIKTLESKKNFMSSYVKFDIRGHVRQLEALIAQYTSPEAFFTAITKLPGITPEILRSEERTSDVVFWRSAWFYVVCEQKKEKRGYDVITKEYFPFSQWQKVRRGHTQTKDLLEVYGAATKKHE